MNFTSKINKIVLLSTILVSSSMFVLAQETPKSDEPDNRPVKSPFEVSTLVDQQTVVSPMAKGFEFNLAHRFFQVSSDPRKLFGIISGSNNVRLGLNYGITDRIMVGIGASYDGLQDANFKIAILRQTRSGSMPLSLSYYGNILIDTHDKSTFDQYVTYKDIYRLSYFNEFIIARKFNNAISLQVAPNMTLYNAVDSAYDNINFGISVNGRAKVYNNIALIAVYDQQLTKPKNISAQPVGAAGIEIGTSTHSFQIYLTNSAAIHNQRDYVFNTNKLFSKPIIGFNLTVRF